jgi:hypothetical protein
MTATVEIEPSAQRSAAQTPSKAGAPAPATAARAPAPATSSGAAPSGEAASLGTAESSAEAILPKLTGAEGSGAAGAPPSALPAAEAAAPAAPRVPPPPRRTPSSAANVETREIASDEAFDRTVNILGTTVQHEPGARAPDTLRRRSRHWRRNDRQ